MRTENREIQSKRKVLQHLAFFFKFVLFVLIFLSPVYVRLWFLYNLYDKDQVI